MGMGNQFGCNIQRENKGYGFGLVRSTSFGRKRVALSNVIEKFDYTNTTPMKRQCSMNSFSCAEKSELESLPQDVLIRIICGVKHDDLKMLFHVSKSIREATLIAKKWHFEYSTPTKTLNFRNAADMEDLNEFNEVEAPNAPKQSKIRKSQLIRKKLTDISVTLFPSADEDNWPKRDSSTTVDIDI